MAAALLRAQGESRVTDTIFENRFACAEGFLRLGASVNVCGRTLHVHGMDLLNGADVEAPDLRGGAALVIAALQAQGSTRVMGAEHISRGYEDIAALLAPLGAHITRSWGEPVSYTHLRAHETGRNLVCRLLLEKNRRCLLYTSPSPRDKA